MQQWNHRRTVVVITIVVHSIHTIYYNEINDYLHRQRLLQLNYLFSSSLFHLQFTAGIVLILIIIINAAGVWSTLVHLLFDVSVSTFKMVAGCCIIIRLLVVACIPTPSSLYLSPFVSIWDDYKVNRCGDGDSNCGIKVDDISGDEDMTTIQLLHRQSSAVTTIRRRFDWIVNEQRDCRG